MGKKKDTGRKSPSHIQRLQENLCNKWCYNPAHQATTFISKKHKRLRIPEAKGFPIGKITMETFHALFKENPEEIKALLQEGKGATRKNWCNCSLLHMAVKCELTEMIRVMYNSVDPNSVNLYNQTAAHIAAQRGKTDMLKELMSFDQFDPEKKDIWNKTFRDYLAAPLFDDVLVSDYNHIKELLQLGASPDGYAGKLSESIAARALKASTPRELAVELNRKPALDLFAKNDRKKSLLKSTVSGKTKISRIRPTRRGFVSIFAYGSFKDRPDLTCAASETDANDLAQCFSEIEYNGGIYSSLTAEETLNVLEDIRDMEMMEDCESLIFYFNSHVAQEGGVHDSFITSDMKALTISHILNIFKESKCPNHLKNKPKLFIFDLFRRSNAKTNAKDLINLDEMNGFDCPYATRSQGKIQNAACIYSSTLMKDCDKEFYSNCSPFNAALCNTLGEEGHYFRGMELFNNLKSLIHKEVINEMYMFELQLSPQFIIRCVEEY